MGGQGAVEVSGWLEEGRRLPQLASWTALALLVLQVKCCEETIISWFLQKQHNPYRLEIHTHTPKKNPALKEKEIPPFYHLNMSTPG